MRVGGSLVCLGVQVLVLGGLPAIANFLHQIRCSPGYELPASRIDEGGMILGSSRSPLLDPRCFPQIQRSCELNNVQILELMAGVKPAFFSTRVLPFFFGSTVAVSTKTQDTALQSRDHIKQHVETYFASFEVKLGEEDFLLGDKPSMADHVRGHTPLRPFVRTCV